MMTDRNTMEWVLEGIWDSLTFGTFRFDSIISIEFSTSSLLMGTCSSSMDTSSTSEDSAGLKLEGYGSCLEVFKMECNPRSLLSWG